MFLDTTTMTLSFGCHSPMAAFADIARQRPVQLLTSRAVGARLASASTTSSIATALRLNPIAVMGGAASTVAVNTDALTTPAIVTMLLLALQYCAQPPITRKFLDSRANKKGITMVEEIVKIALSAFFFLSCGECGGREESFDVRI